MGFFSKEKEDGAHKITPGLLGSSIVKAQEDLIRAKIERAEKGGFASDNKAQILAEAKRRLDD